MVVDELAGHAGLIKRGTTEALANHEMKTIVREAWEGRSEQRGVLNQALHRSSLVMLRGVEQASHLEWCLPTVGRCDSRGGSRAGANRRPDGWTYPVSVAVAVSVPGGYTTRVAHPPGCQINKINLQKVRSSMERIAIRPGDFVVVERRAALRRNAWLRKLIAGGGTP